MLGGCFLAQLTILDKLRKQGSPFAAEEIGAREGTVAADHNQAVNTSLHKIFRGDSAPRPRAKLLAARRADDRPSLLQDTAYRIPIHFVDAGSAFHKPLISFINCVNFRAFI